MGARLLSPHRGILPRHKTPRVRAVSLPGAHFEFTDLCLGIFPVGGVRYRLSANCSTPASPSPTPSGNFPKLTSLILPNMKFWDPVKGTCLCIDSACAFTDNTGPISSFLLLFLRAFLPG